MRISDWSSDVCSSDILMQIKDAVPLASIVGHKEWVCLCADRSERRQMMEHEHAKSDPDRRRLSVVNIVLEGFLVIAGFFLLLEHRAPLLGWFHFLIPLLCSLMTIFMHGRHGGSSEHPIGGRDTVQ